ncbi:hypothetical protein HJG60_008881 [Phyllostomus discolor]|uniref:Mitotic-spindle organizing protein 2B n=1 Tax=Phyllostomus discolor TaxID=89673 RepID=A0A833YSQ9_9CHIR|nr:hypothetical protein HJG60_008881 [Phyllostomus discolor]
MAAPGSGPGPPPGLEAALQKLALRRKKVLSAEEMELYELAQAAGGAMDPDVFKILVDLLKLNVAPLAVFQMLKSMCAGQRLASEPQDSAAVSLPTSSMPETRGQSWGALLPLWPRRWGFRGQEVGSARHSRARSSGARPFCRSSPRTHWPHPRALPFGSVPSFGFSASLESTSREGGGRVSAPAWPKQARVHLGLLLSQPLLTSSLMPSNHTYRDETALVPVLLVCEVSTEIFRVGRQRPSYSPLPYMYLTQLQILSRSLAS